MILSTKKRYFFFLILITFLLTAYWFRHGNLMGAAESGLLFYDIQSHYENTRWAWHSYIIGGPTVHTTATLPLHFFLALLESIGISGFLLEFGFFYFCLLLSSIGLYYLVNLLNYPKNIENKYIFLATLFYIGNPITQINVWNRFLYNHTLFFAILPFAFYFFIKGFIKKNFRYSLISALFLTIFSYALSAPAFLLLIWMFFGFISVFYFARHKKYKIFSIVYLTTAFFSYLTLNSWWLSQMFVGVFDTISSAQTTNLFSSTGNLNSLIVLSERLGKFRDLIRFAHADFSLNNFFVNSIGYVIFFLGVLFIARHLKEKTTQLLLFLFTITIFLIKGASGIFGGIFIFLFERIFLLQFFRNPFEKFAFLYILIFTAIFALSLNKYIKNNFFYNIILILLIVFTYPMLNGDVFSYESSGEKINYSVSVPNEYKDINQSINDKQSRILALPFTNEGVIYDWDDEYIGVELSRVLMKNPSISLQTSVSYYDIYSKNLLNNQANSDLFYYIPYANVRYLFTRDDIMTNLQNIPNKNIVEENIAELDKELIYESDSYSVYDLFENKNYYWPRFYLTNNIIASNNTDFATINSKVNDFPNIKNVVINSSKENYEISNYRLITPEKTFTPILSGYQNNLTDKELVDSLIYVKHSPEDFYYPLLLIKEEINSPPKENRRKYVNYQIELLGKRAVEIHNLYKKNADSSVIKQAEQKYLEYLERLFGYEVLDDVYLNELLYQYELLRRLEFSELDEIDNYLQTINLKPIFSLPEVSGENEYVIYHLNSPSEYEYDLDLIESNNIWLNGNKIDNFNGEVRLVEGFNEVAVLYSKNTLLRKIHEESNFNFENENSYSIEVDVQENKDYLFKYNYDFVEGDSYNLHISRLIDEDYRTILNSDFAQNEYNFGVTEQEVDVSTSPGTSKLKIIFSVDELLSTEITNFTILEKNIPEIILQAGELKNESSLSKVEFEKINPTKYIINISKIGNDPEILVFSDLFDNKWQIVNEDFKHLKVNQFANGWIIDSEGSYQFELVYKPQKVLETFSLVSIMSFLFFCFILSVKINK